MQHDEEIMFNSMFLQVGEAMKQHQKEFNEKIALKMEPFFDNLEKLFVFFMRLFVPIIGITIIPYIVGYRRMRYSKKDKCWFIFTASDSVTKEPLRQPLFRQE